VFWRCSVLMFGVLAKSKMIKRERDIRGKFLDFMSKGLIEIAIWTGESRCNIKRAHISNESFITCNRRRP
jgi:hypothetical protein